MDNQPVEQGSTADSRKAHRGWWLGLAIVVVLALVIHYAYQPTRGMAGARATDPEYLDPALQHAIASTTSSAAAPPTSAALSRELVEMEAAGLVTLGRSGSALAFAPTPRELVEMEAAGLVTLARSAVPTSTLRPVFPRELVEMEAAGLVTLARSAAPTSARRSVFARELVEMEAAGLATLSR
ncbi:MAG: hypothetical protein U0822_22085 [Anaerolineae bacterium]